MISTCTVDDCTKPVQARGWCSKHYHRARRHGSPHAARLTADELIAEVEHLLDNHATVWRIPGQLGYTKPASLARTLERHGRDDLASPFRTREAVA